jgi:hypothetical protein
VRRCYGYGFKLATALLICCLAVPVAFAQDSGRAAYTNGAWKVECSSFGGIVSYTVDMYVPGGAVVDIDRVRSYGDGNRRTWDLQQQGVWATSGSRLLWVPAGGTVQETVKLYAAGGQIVATVHLYANCATGEIAIDNSSGIHQPEAGERVQGLMLVDTPVYAEPNPDMALIDLMLREGQTWFIVGSTTGTDGNLWYEVFVGGAQNAYVPAEAVALSGPVPPEE